MIDRLNFYDLYGYLIPGLTLLGFLWLPFHLGTTVRLPSEWASAFAAAVLGYVAGHLLPPRAEVGRRAPALLIADPRRHAARGARPGVRALRPRADAAQGAHPQGLRPRRRADRERSGHGAHGAAAERRVHALPRCAGPEGRGGLRAA